MKLANTLLLLLGLPVIVSCTSSQQATTQTPEKFTQMLTDRQYQFYATYVQPSSGRQRNLTGTYTLNVRKTEIVADLPYIGRAYNADIGSTDGGIKFKSTDFEYTEKPGKKGSTEITIKLKDVSDTRELFLTVFDNGTANLRVSSVNRQAISFLGELRVLPATP